MSLVNSSIREENELNLVLNIMSSIKYACNLKLKFNPLSSYDFNLLAIRWGFYDECMKLVNKGESLLVIETQLSKKIRDRLIFHICADELIESNVVAFLNQQSIKISQAAILSAYNLTPGTYDSLVLDWMGGIEIKKVDEKKQDVQLEMQHETFQGVIRFYKYKHLYKPQTFAQNLFLDKSRAFHERVF